MSSLIFGRVSGCLRTTAGILRSTARFSSCSGEPRGLISPSPWLMLPPSKSKDAGGVMLDNFYSPAHNKVCRIGGGGGLVLADDAYHKVVGSSHGYVALHKSGSSEVFLWNPVSRERINLPPIHTDVHPYVDKVIVSDSDCNVVVMPYCGHKEYSLAFCCPGRSEKWTHFGDSYHIGDDGEKTSRVYEDLAYSRRLNRLFCITDGAVVERWDLEDPISPRLESSFEVEEYNCLSVKYVVVEERSDQVYIVQRNLVERNLKIITVGFDVYKIDEEGGRKVVRNEGSLGGLVMFVGINHSFALPAADYPELIPDSIYFTASHYGDEMGVFDYKNETISPCFYPFILPHDDYPGQEAPFWFTPTTTIN